MSAYLGIASIGCINFKHWYVEIGDKEWDCKAIMVES